MVSTGEHKQTTAKIAKPQEVIMTERISHNSLIKSDLIDAGFDVWWNLNDGLIVSLNRHLFISEVQEALYDAGYEEGMFTTCSDSSHGVVVDAVGTFDQGQCKITTIKTVRSPLTEGIDDGI